MSDFRDRIPSSIRALADELDADYSHLHAVLRGDKQPSVKLAKRIETATAGAIKWDEFFAGNLSESA